MVPLSSDQLAARRSGLGGSDVAAVAGVHPYKTPTEVYLEKIGEAGPKVAGVGSPMWWGNRLEPIIADAYAHERGVELIDPQETRRDPKHSWRLWTPDRLVKDERRGLEIKAPGSFPQLKRWGRRGTDDVPPECLVQCHWYLSAEDYDEWDVAALVIRDLRTYTIKRDKEFESNLLEIAERFWRDHVVKRVPPIADYTEGQ